MPPTPIYGFTPTQSALYTYDMLESLRKIAVQQNQHLLAHLLQLAALEAKSLGIQGGHDTSLPA